MNIENQSPVAKPHIVWLDAMRFAAMVLLVVCHSTGPFNYMPDPTIPEADSIKFWGALWGASARSVVPLFVMITGALLLPIHQETFAFCRKRIGRVLWPFLIWSVLYALFPWITAVLGLDGHVVRDCLPYSGDAYANRSLMASLVYIVQTPLQQSALATHLWYIYLLIGIYLYLPVFSSWVEHSTRQTQRAYLLVWAVTLFMPYVVYLWHPYIFGMTAFNEFHALYYFAGFNGYLLLGHYLRHTEWSLGKTVSICVPLFVVGYLVSFFGFRWVCTWPKAEDRQFELFFYYCSASVAMMTFAIFMLVKQTRITASWAVRLLANLTRCGFGIYMIHYFFSGPSVMLVRWIGVPMCVQIPVAGAIMLSVSWGIVALCRRGGGRVARIIWG